MQTKAVLRYARISPQKCRLVVDTIRGKSATLAVNTLKFMPKKGAKIVLKVLDSAIANAYNNFNADVDDLKVTRIEVDPAFLASEGLEMVCDAIAAAANGALAAADKAVEDEVAKVTGGVKLPNLTG